MHTRSVKHTGYRLIYAPLRLKSDPSMSKDATITAHIDYVPFTSPWLLSNTSTRGQVRGQESLTATDMVTVEEVVVMLAVNKEAKESQAAVVYEAVKYFAICVWTFFYTSPMRETDHQDHFQYFGCRPMSELLHCVLW